MIPHVISGPTIAAYIRGQNRVVDLTHPAFEDIKAALRGGNATEDEIYRLIDSAEALRVQTVFFKTNLITVGYETVFYNGEPIDNHLCDVILKMAHEGLSIEPWVAFLERMLLNPDPETRRDLFAWLEKAKMPITPDGHFLAYKKVRDDYTSFHDHKTRNDIGSSPFMPREEVDHSRTQLCSAGLHFCSHGHLPSYHGNKGKVVVLKINPADVCAIPLYDDRDKGRAWRYTVIDELKEKDAAFAFPSPVYHTSYDEEPVHGTFDDEPAPPVGILGRLKAWTKRFLH